ncbi:MAG: ThiF family adenylyltransferase [Cellulosilyticaceae bacterium]
MSNRKQRYSRNGTCINETEQKVLSKAKICILGCGGLGGYMIEMLARVGVGALRVVDGDVFDPSNLNRQILANQNNLNQEKVIIASKHVAEINSEVIVEAVPSFINESNAEDILRGCTVVMDALDNLSVRKMVADTCSKLNIPYIYGAIAGWYGQVSVILPNSTTDKMLFSSQHQRGEEQRVGNPSFTPAIVAGIQVSECIKLLLKKGEITTNAFLMIDLLTNEVEKITIIK